MGNDGFKRAITQRLPRVAAYIFNPTRDRDGSPQSVKAEPRPGAPSHDTFAHEEAGPAGTHETPHTLRSLSKCTRDNSLEEFNSSTDTNLCLRCKAIGLQNDEFGEHFGPSQSVGNHLEYQTPKLGLNYGRCFLSSIRDTAEDCRFCFLMKTSLEKYERLYLEDTGDLEVMELSFLCENGLRGLEILFDLVRDEKRVRSCGFVFPITAYQCKSNECSPSAEVNMKLTRRK